MQAPILPTNVAYDAIKEYVNTGLHIKEYANHIELVQAGLNFNLDFLRMLKEEKIVRLIGTQTPAEQPEIGENMEGEYRTWKGCPTTFYDPT